MGAGALWEISAVSVQVFCEPIAALQNEVYVKNRNPGEVITSFYMQSLVYCGVRHLGWDLSPTMTSSVTSGKLLNPSDLGFSNSTERLTSSSEHSEYCIKKLYVECLTKYLGYMPG